MLEQTLSQLYYSRCPWKLPKSHHSVVILVRIWLPVSPSDHRTPRLLPGKGILETRGHERGGGQLLGSMSAS